MDRDIPENFPLSRDDYTIGWKGGWVDWWADVLKRTLRFLIFAG